MKILVDPATQVVSVSVPYSNTAVFYEGCEHDNYYVGINPAVMDWLDAHDPEWDCVDGFDDSEFVLSSMGLALLFKLTWCGV